MAERKFGKVYKMSEKFEDYSYIINGVGGIGKTTLVYEIGKLVTGSNEGTFIITCGGENKPKHIPDAFGDVAPDFKTFAAIVKELCTNREAYPDTKFVAIDSLDEYARIAENYVVAEWNASCDINDRAKSISQAYKGFQKGESRACDLMIQQVVKLQDAGYSILEIGHTKTKSKSDVITQVQFEQLTCNLDNKYYNALKDKVNLVAMCYFEHVIDNVEEKKNAFTKKMDKVGELVDRKRVMVFADDDNAIDCKSHFEYIAHKIDFDAKGFVEAVEEAIALKLAAVNGNEVKQPAKKKSKPVVETVAVEPEDIDEEASNIIDEDDTVPFDVDDLDDAAEIEVDLDAIRTEIRNKNKAGTPEQKKAVKAILASSGKKLDELDDVEVLTQMLEVFE
jgi:hypothetical protein